MNVFSLRELEQFLSECLAKLEVFVNRIGACDFLTANKRVYTPINCARQQNSILKKPETVCLSFEQVSYSGVANSLEVVQAMHTKEGTDH